MHSMKYILEQQIQKSIHSRSKQHSISRLSGTVHDFKGIIKTNESVDSFGKSKDEADLGNAQYMKLSKSY